MKISNFFMHYHFDTGRIVRECTFFLFTVFMSTVTAQASDSASDSDCGSLKGGWYGPFDRRTATATELSDVEQQHFNRPIETLNPSLSIRVLAGNIGYTLRAFPNHLRALDSLSRLSVRANKDLLPGAGFSTECYFERARRFRPDDPGVHLIYGIHLMRSGRNAAAVSALDKAKGLDPSDPNIDYNLGLAHFELQDYDKSLAAAKAAYGKGWPLDGLRKKLRKLGKWND